MGGSSSTTYVYQSNEHEVKTSLSNISKQLGDVAHNVNCFRNDTQMTVFTVQQNINLIDKKFEQINDGVSQCFHENDRKLKQLTDYAEQVARIQTLSIKNLHDENFIIAQHIWKQDYLEKIQTQMQTIQNIKNTLEREKQQKIISYLLMKDEINTNVHSLLSESVLFIDSNMSHIVKHLIIENNNVIAHELTLPDICSQTIITNGINDIWSKLDIEIKSVFDSINILNEKFIELDKTKCELEQDVRTKIENFTNNTLINCLSPDIKSQDFAEKIFDSGFFDIEDICMENEDRLLVSNGYIYMPEYKYGEMRNKYLMGFESMNKQFFEKVSDKLYKCIFVKINKNLLMGRVLLDKDWKNNKSKLSMGRLKFNTIYDIMKHLKYENYPYKFMCCQNVLMHLTIKFYNRLLLAGYPIKLFEDVIKKIQKGLNYIEEKLRSHPFMEKWAVYGEEWVNGTRFRTTSLVRDSLRDLYLKSKREINIFAITIIVRQITVPSIMFDFVDSTTGVVLGSKRESFQMITPKVLNVRHSNELTVKTLSLSEGKIRNDFPFKSHDVHNVEKVLNLTLGAFQTYVFYSMASKNGSGLITDEMFENGLKFI